MSDPESDRIQYLLDQREACVLTEAEQTELAIYKAEGKVNSLAVREPMPVAPQRRALDYAQPVTAIVLGIVALAFGAQWWIIIFFWVFALTSMPRAIGDDGLWKFSVGRRSEPDEDEGRTKP